jgi:anti-sigma regulatory factor (Ser/Thr protein kinase)
LRAKRPGYGISVLLDIALRLSPDAQSPAEARKSLEALRVSLDDPVVDDAALLVSEIVSNSVRHADLDPSDAIEVRIRGSRSMLHVDVIDPGPGFEPERARRRHDGGWGLFFLDRVATRWGVERDDRTRVWFDLAPPSVSSTAAPGR